MPEAIEVTLNRASETRFARTGAPISDRTWRDAVGSRIADRARPIELERGILVIRAATNVWASELSLLSEDLLARLRDRGVAVVSLRFRVGAVDPFERPPDRRRTRAVPAPAALPAPLEQAILAVPDEELRKTIAEAARANLAWQTHVQPPTTAANEERRAARAPRSAETESDLQVQTSEASPAASRRTLGASPRRSR
jgi:predicted nucleic acid-binding Zn ribbon protein